MRFLIAFFSATIVTIGFFILMTWLIINNNKASISDLKNFNALDFIRVKHEVQTHLKERRKPPKPLKPPQKTLQPAKTIQQQNLDVKSIEIPTFKLAPNLKNITQKAVVGGIRSPQNNYGEIIPLVRYEPEYPRAAKQRSIEGWVKVKFTITEIGTVEDLKILASKPHRIFNKSALRAIQRWKFKPKMMHGKPVKRYNVIQIIEFKL